MHHRNMSLVGFLTWLLVGVSSLIWELQHHAVVSQKSWYWLAFFATFIVFYWQANRPGCSETRLLTMLLLESATALACVALQPVGFSPILLVIIAAQVGRYRLPVALTWVLLQSAVLVLAFRKGESTLSMCLSYFSFQLFALLAMRTAHGESEARLALAEANAELTVTAGLLEISSRTSERLRISRDLHDLLGHHLTALSLNLEVASHLTSGEARESIDRSKDITRLLLSDVRDVVSSLRDDEPVDLAAALESLSRVITSPAVHLELEGALDITDSAIAQLILRAAQELVTNAVRHSGARNLWLRLERTGTTLTLIARDDGTGSDRIAFGNGLRGLRERINEAGGTLEVASARGQGFTSTAILPLGART